MSEHRTTIIVSIIGLVSAISVALITNWDNIFPNGKDNSETSISSQTEARPVENKPTRTSVCEVYDLDSTATCQDFYNQRKNKTSEYLKKCGYHQINQYMAALDIKSRAEWTKFVAQCK